MSPHAVIDVGSNTIRLLVGEVEDGAVVPVAGEKISARLESGVDKTGRIEEASIPVAAKVVRLFALLATLNGAPKPTVLATSAIREAENGPALVEEVRKKAGLGMRLISGEEEASLDFCGAISVLGADSLLEGRKALVVDLKGGSTQLILGDVQGSPEKQASLPLGSNRTSERYVGHDPPKAEELEAVREAVLKVLPEWSLPEDTRVVAIGGSARAVMRVIRHWLTRENLEQLAARISTKPSGALAREEGLAPSGRGCCRRRSPRSRPYWSISVGPPSPGARRDKGGRDPRHRRRSQK